MKLPWRKRTDNNQLFLPPKTLAHRGFAYLDDDIVINSLSALESGKVDEVVEKINLAQESGMSVGLKLGVQGAGVNAGGDTKASESLQAEVIRRRTRFSIFELWHEALSSREAIGRFNGWGNDALNGVAAGQVIELRGSVTPVALHTGMRMYLWFANEVRENNPLFKDTIENSNMEEINASEHIMKFLRGKREETNALIVPQGDDGPTVGASFREEWIVEPVGRWDGTFTLIAQVDNVVEEGGSWPSVRIIEDAPLTPMEETVIKEALAPMQEAISAFGLDVDDESISISGPALVLRPIAMYRLTVQNIFTLLREDVT